MGLGPRDVPGAVSLPCYPGWGEDYRRGGPYGGFLGSQYDPLFSLCNPKFSREPKTKYYDPVMPEGEPYLPGLNSQPGLLSTALTHATRFWNNWTIHSAKRASRPLKVGWTSSSGGPSIF